MPLTIYILSYSEQLLCSREGIFSLKIVIQIIILSTSYFVLQKSLVINEEGIQMSLEHFVFVNNITDPKGSVYVRMRSSYKNLNLKPTHLTTSNSSLSTIREATVTAPSTIKNRGNPTKPAKFKPISAESNAAKLRQGKIWWPKTTNLIT